MTDPLKINKSNSGTTPKEATAEGYYDLDAGGQLNIGASILGTKITGLESLDTQAGADEKVNIDALADAKRLREGKTADGEDVITFKKGDKVYSLVTQDTGAILVEGDATGKNRNEYDPGTSAADKEKRLLTIENISANIPSDGNKADALSTIASKLFGIKETKPKAEAKFEDVHKSDDSSPTQAESNKLYNLIEGSTLELDSSDKNVRIKQLLSGDMSGDSPDKTIKVDALADTDIATDGNTATFKNDGETVATLKVTDGKATLTDQKGNTILTIDDIGNSTVSQIADYLKSNASSESASNDNSSSDGTGNLDRYFGKDNSDQTDGKDHSSDLDISKVGTGKLKINDLVDQWNVDTDSLKRFEKLYGDSNTPSGIIDATALKKADLDKDGYVTEDELSKVLDANDTSDVNSESRHAVRDLQKTYDAATKFEKTAAKLTDKSSVAQQQRVLDAYDKATGDLSSDQISQFQDIVTERMTGDNASKKEQHANDLLQQLVNGGVSDPNAPPPLLNPPAPPFGNYPPPPVYPPAPPVGNYPPPLYPPVQPSPYGSYPPPAFQQPAPNPFTSSGAFPVPGAYPTVPGSPLYSLFSGMDPNNPFGNAGGAPYGNPLAALEGGGSPYGASGSPYGGPAGLPYGGTAGLPYGNTGSPPVIVEQTIINVNTPGTNFNSFNR